MSNLPQNPYNNILGPPQGNANAAAQMYNHSQFNQVPPPSQLPPGYGGLKQDANSNSPLQAAVPAPLIAGQIQSMDNYNQSASSSPAFNHPGMMPPANTGLQSSPMRPPMKPTSIAHNPIQFQSPNIPLTSTSLKSAPNVAVSSSYPTNFPHQQKQINANAPPLISSSQYNQPVPNGPPMPAPPASIPGSQFSTPSNTISPLPTTGLGLMHINQAFRQQQGPPNSKLGSPMTSHPNVPFSGPPLLGPPRNSPLLSNLVNGPPISGPPPTSGVPNLPRQLHTVSSDINGSTNYLSRPLLGPPVSGPTMDTHKGIVGNMGPPYSGPPSVPPISGPPTSGQSYLDTLNYIPSGSGQLINPPAGPMKPPNNYSGSQGLPSGYQSLPPKDPPLTSAPSGVPGASGLHRPGPSVFSGPTGSLRAPTSTQADLGSTTGQLSGPSKSIMQHRYPQISQSNYTNHQMPQQGTPSMGNQYQQQYSTQGLTHQMGQLSVTNQGFDQLWGHEMVDLLQTKHTLPEYPEDPPEIRLGDQFADSPNCSPEIFRCTVNRIPDTNSLLQKSRLPLGILIHPFKDLNHLPVIQCTTIVRCRACRTYINPFVYFVDAKRWKCNLCYRVNDLPEEFQYDPVTRSYGDPTRRPEIKSATIEFIAPGEYMLRPPQPAVYLFLIDVSQMARESGYLQVLCDTLKTNLDQLPGDTRTQVGFICFDAHIHFYLMSDGLTRPKEMTVLDIDDVFLPSPESLLVNLVERREMVKELLTVLPQRHSALTAPSCALGAALQAAYKLMAPTGGRITVFQSCLPNVGPGALQPREDPNARSSKEVAHLNPATDFYKRLALECSGAQVAVDLFLLSAQYCDLATLSGMSKFSGGAVYHIPLFRASRSWQADQFRRMLTRYLTRKIGFEAVMRIRCTRGIAIHTFHGNFFVRSTDLLSLPNVSPDAGFGMQLTIEESLTDLQQVCFQAALLYTSSKGERRIRVHTLALPIASNLTDVLHSADQQCIIGLLSKMAVDRCATASMSEAREALINVAVDALSAFRLAQNLPAGSVSPSLHAPASLRLLPLYLLALLKRKAFRTGTSTRLDDRVADMCDMKCMPLPQLMRAVYPDLYAVHALHLDMSHDAADGDPMPDPPRMHLSAERINSNGAYLVDDGETLLIYVCQGVSPAFLSETFGVTAFSQLPDEARSLPQLDTEGNALLQAFINRLNEDRPYASNLLIIRDNSPCRQLFFDRLLDDRMDSAFSYYEFLQHVKNQVK